MAMNEFEKALVYAMGATFRFDLYDDDGNPTGLQFAGDVSSFTSAATAERVERKAHTRGDDGSPPYDSVIGSLESERSLEFTLTFGSHTDQMLGAYFFGMAKALNQSAGAVSPVSITAGALDTWQAIGDHHFLESATAEASGGSALTLDTDFQISPRLGMIKFLSGGAVSPGDVISVTPTLAALSGASEIEIMGRKTLTGRMVIDMYNRVSGQARDILMDLRKVSLTPSGNSDFMTSEFLDTEFTMSIQYDQTINPATNKAYGYGSFILGKHPRA